MGAADNPYSTGYLTGGAVLYRFPEGQSLAGILQQIKAAHYHAVLYGPHGNGKTTLLYTIKNALEAEGKRCYWHHCDDENRSMPLRAFVEATRADVFFLDGGEVLYRFHFFLLRLFCKVGGCGIIRTNLKQDGRTLSIPIKSDPQRLISLIREDIRPDGPTLSDEEIIALYQQHNGDIREVLFDLYDQYEEHDARQKPTAQPSFRESDAPQ